MSGAMGVSVHTATLRDSLLFAGSSNNLGLNNLTCEIEYNKQIIYFQLLQNDWVFEAFYRFVNSQYQTRRIEDIETFYRIATCWIPFTSNQGKLTKRVLFDIQKNEKYNACCCIELNNNTPSLPTPCSRGGFFFFYPLNWTGQK